LPYQKKEPFPTKKKPEGQHSKKEAQRPTGEGSDFSLTSGYAMADL